MTRRSKHRNLTDLNADDNDDPRQEQHPLIERADSRAYLEAMRDTYTDRLHQRSDDFDATRRLRLVSAKLQRTSHGTQVVSVSS